MGFEIARRLVGGSWRTGVVDEPDANGDSQPIEAVEVVLTDAQIKTLLIPITLITPDDSDHVPVVTDVTYVLDDSDGVYTDADGGYNLRLGYMPDPGAADTKIMDGQTIVNADFGAPGPGVWSLWTNLREFVSAGRYWGQLGASSIGTPPQPTGAIALSKAGAANYAGGGAGNTLTVRLIYSSIKVVP